MASMRKGGTARALAAGLLLGATATIGAVRAPLFEREKQITERHDVYFLPPPAQLKQLSLGYKAAVADLIWAHVLVSQGIHTFERRRFENLTRLYDALYALDPKWRTPYLLAEALITFQTDTTPLEEIIKLREILERGVEERPYDAELWVNLGSFVAFLAPASYIEEHDPELAAQWRIEGTRYLARGAELGTGQSDFSWRALGGANILQRQGKASEAIRFLERTYAITEDPELRADIEKRLSMLRAQLARTDDFVEAMQVDASRRRNRILSATLRDEAPFLRPAQALVMSPPLDPARCAGGARTNQASCATTWRSWDEIVQPRVDRELELHQQMALPDGSSVFGAPEKSEGRRQDKKPESPKANGAPPPSAGSAASSPQK